MSRPSRITLREPSRATRRRSVRLPAEPSAVSEEEKREACCYASQERFWLSDPDGNFWEVYTVLEDLEHESRAGEDSAACCCRA